MSYGIASRCIAVRQRVEDHLAALQVEARHLREQDAHVLLAPEDAAQRRSDLGGRERAGRNLVGERLKEMEVAPVDERDVDRGAAQLAHRLQPREAAADDDDARATYLPRCVFHAPTIGDRAVPARAQARPRAFARTYALTQAPAKRSGRASTTVAPAAPTRRAASVRTRCISSATVIA